MPTTSKSTKKPTNRKTLATQTPTFGKTPAAKPAGVVKPTARPRPAGTKPRQAGIKPAAKSGVDNTHFSDKMTGALKNSKEFARDAHALARKIDNANELVQKVLPGVERALTTADISGLQQSSGDVAELTRALQDMIPAGNQ